MFIQTLTRHLQKHMRALVCNAMVMAWLMENIYVAMVICWSSHFFYEKHGNKFLYTNWCEWCASAYLKITLQG